MTLDTTDERERAKQVRDAAEEDPSVFEEGRPATQPLAHPTHQGQGRVGVPEPASGREETLDARIRLKLDRGEALSQEERRFLATLPGEKEVKPSELD